jgi:radical SAM superfamily enzyme YgiQ (UPF0313 family)
MLEMSQESNVLLIFPIWVRSSGRGKLQRSLPPLGILSIASYLETKGHKVSVLDLHASPMSPAEFRTFVQKLKPNYVGITVLSNHFIPAHHIATICKQESPGCKVITGGVHAESCPGQMLKNPAIDAVCIGDGEEVMADFVSGKSFSEIPGLCFVDHSHNIIQNRVRPQTKDLDQYPFPAYHLIDFNNYFPAMGSYRNYPAINAIMTRGCPGKCTFCNSAKTLLRGRSPEKMADLIQHLREQHGIRQISFYDDTFTANPKSLRTFCNELIRRKIDVSFICYARGDMFTEEIAGLLKKAGCHQVFLGIESGSIHLTEKIGKPIELSKYKKVVETAHKFGIEVRGGFIVGHLDETKETLEQTYQFAKDLDLDFFLPSILTPYPGTELYKKAKAENLLIHEDYSMYGQGEVILKMKHLTKEELLKFYRNIFIKFHLRPRVIWRQLKRTRSLYHLLDLLDAFKVLVFQRLHSGRTRNLNEWLNFNLESVSRRGVQFSDVPRLTWEVRDSGERTMSL